MKAFFTACVVSLTALILGVSAALTVGGALSGWVMSASLALLMAAALGYGFCAAMPSLSPLLWARPLQGTALVCLGIVAVFLPPQFCIAAILLAAGTRTVWSAACELADAERPAADATVVMPGAAIVPSPRRGGMARQDWRSRD